MGLAGHTSPRFAGPVPHLHRPAAQARLPSSQAFGCTRSPEHACKGATEPQLTVGGLADLVLAPRQLLGGLQAPAGVGNACRLRARPREARRLPAQGGRPLSAVHYQQKGMHVCRHQNWGVPLPAAVKGSCRQQHTTRAHLGRQHDRVGPGQRPLALLPPRINGCLGLQVGSARCRRAAVKQPDRREARGSCYVGCATARAASPLHWAIARAPAAPRQPAAHHRHCHPTPPHPTCFSFSTKGLRSRFSGRSSSSLQGAAGQQAQQAQQQGLRVGVQPGQAPCAGSGQGHSSTHRPSVHRQREGTSRSALCTNMPPAALVCAMLC